MTTVSSASGNSAAYQAYKSDMFKRLDTDGNGSLSKEEAAAGRPSETSAKSRSAAVGASDSTSAATSSPESFLSGDAMAVLMLMKQQGGFSFDGGSDGNPSVASISAQMDADGDGSITQAEFVSSRPENVSEEDAATLFKSIDSDDKGSLTAEELDAGMKASAPPPPGGAPSGASSSETEDEVFDSMDTNKDGVVSQDEFLAYDPGAAEQAATETSVKVDSSSIKGKLLDELMERLSATRAAIQQSLATEAETLAKADDLAGSATADTTIAGA
jgi:Ca2+-binding EF-hand superfamily protein